MDLVDLPAFAKNKFQIDFDSGTPAGLHSTYVNTGRKNSMLFARMLCQKEKRRNCESIVVHGAPSHYSQFVAMIANPIHFIGQIDNVRVFLLQKHYHRMLW